MAPRLGSIPLVAFACLALSAGSTPRASGPPVNPFVQTIDYPGATATYPYAINDAGVIAGTVFLATESTGFLRYPDGTIGPPIVFPDDTQQSTAAYGINNGGTIVGDALTLENGLFRARGYLLRGGDFTIYDHPGVPFTTITGVNAQGNLAGMTNDGDNHFRAFVDVRGNITDFDAPGPLVGVGAINARNQIVGTFQDGPIVRGFLRHSNGLVTAISAPGANFTTASAINNAGVIAGFFADPSDPTSGHGYLLTHGAFVTFDVPGASVTNILGINDAQQVVGYYVLRNAPSRVHGFVAALQPD